VAVLDVETTTLLVVVDEAVVALELEDGIVVDEEAEDI
jgi:hypothetical protein